MVIKENTTIGTEDTNIKIFIKSTQRQEYKNDLSYLLVIGLSID